MEIKDLIQSYIDINRDYHSKRDKIEKQIERLEKKLRKLEHPFWINEIIIPIAEEMLKEMLDRRYEILGPFGLTCETAIHFYKIDSTRENELDDCKSITFRPTNLEEGKVSLVDYTKDTQRYSVGTMGEVNGMNYPTIPIKNTIAELIEFMDRKEKAEVNPDK